MKDLKSVNAELNLNNNLDMDIRYADDTTLLAVVFEKLNISTCDCRRPTVKTHCALQDPDVKPV